VAHRYELSRSAARCSMLYGLEIPPSGGNTHFCGMQAVWKALPAALKAKVGTRRIKHDGTFNSGRLCAPGRDGDRTIRTRRRVRGILRFACIRSRESPRSSRPPPQFYVEGLTPAQSTPLLDELWQFRIRAVSLMNTLARRDLVLWITLDGCTGATPSTTRRAG